MGFGETVGALLDTYTNCLSLLKVFKRRSGDADSRGGDNDQQSLLRRSLRADRAKVRRAYSSRLSESGSRFEKGDTRAKSALSRVLKKLTAAIVNLLRMSSRNQSPALDYESLMSLSSASRMEAVRAMDQLSHRLGSSSSRSSVVSSSSLRHRRHKSSGSSSGASSSSSHSHKTNKTKASSTKSSKEKSKKAKAPEASTSKAKGKGKEEAAKLSKHRASSHSQRPSTASEDKQHSRNTSRASHVSNRASILTVSTDSTKLGEIPERKLHRRYDYDTGSDEYNVRPVYPLKPYQPVVKERRFWGLFKRGS